MEIMNRTVCEFVKRVVVTTLVILMLAFIIDLIFMGLNVRKAIRDLDLFTLIIAFSAVLGKALGTLTPPAGIASSSIAAPSVADYAHEAARRVVDDPLLSWITLLIAVALAYGIAILLKNIFA